MKFRFLSVFTFSLLFFFIFIIQPVFAQYDSLPFANTMDTGYVVIKKINIIGNKITKRAIITREIIFHQGDTVRKDLFPLIIDRVHDNLMNTNLFNFVQITPLPDLDNGMEVNVILKERWYWFPIPIVEFVDRNFNEWYKTKDFRRANYGLFLVRDNFRGRGETVRLRAQLGYTENISLYYNIPYLNKRQRTGISFSTGLSRSKEIGYNVIDNKLLFYHNNDKYIRYDFGAVVRLNHRRGIYNNIFLQSEYYSSVVNDTIPALNENYFLPDERRRQLINLTCGFRHDKRDFKNYPLKGFYFDTEVVKQGFGLLKYEPDNFYATSTAKKYFQLNNRFYFAGSLRGKLSSGKQIPFSITRALGYRIDQLRGYEYYVINGQHFILAKTNLKFALVPQKVVLVNSIRSEKFNTIPYAFYINLFGEAAYVSDKQYYQNNSLANEVQYCYGLGMDYVSYYNIVLRVDYSFNKFGEHGFFIHFAAPI